LSKLSNSSMRRSSRYRISWKWVIILSTTCGESHSTGKRVAWRPWTLNHLVLPLYILTCVSHRLAFIAYPLYLMRKGLTFSSFNNIASLSREAYKALDVLRRWFNLLPSEITNFFEDMSINFIEVESPWDLQHLIQSAASATGCSMLSLSGVFYLEGASGDRTSKRVTYSTSTPALKNL
jgi:hypothetical protein